MKTMAFAALAAALLSAGAAHAGTLRLTIEGVQPKGGQVLVAVQTKEQFMLPVHTAGGIVDGGAKGDLTLVLPVPDGEYAIMVMHDADSDYSLKTDSSGAPLEGVASAHGALDSFPVFDLVKVAVNGDTALTARMLYPAD